MKPMKFSSFKMRNSIELISYENNNPSCDFFINNIATCHNTFWEKDVRSPCNIVELLKENK